MKETAILYSGGTDSTCVAALMAQDFQRVHLLTFIRFGVSSAENSVRNLRRLEEKFGADKFVHKLINIDKLFYSVSYSGYLRNLLKHRFFLLFTCGLCKLAMHLRALVYCLENNIREVRDGSNKNMALFQEQMREICSEFKEMYARYGVNYETPVFEFEDPQVDYFNKFDLAAQEPPNPASLSSSDRLTTGDILFNLGIFPQRNLKGTSEGRRMQGRCMQLVLFNIFATWYYLPYRSLEEYKKAASGFIRERIAYFLPILDEYVDKKASDRLTMLL